MVPLLSLWLPILLSAVLVFVVSSVIHMFLGYHANDYGAAPNEEEVRGALRPLRPGQYVVPHATGMAAMKEEPFVRKMTEGPVAFLTVRESGPPAMGRQLGLWFLYGLVVSYLAAYIASRALAPGAEYLEVFRFAGTTAFIGYAIGTWQESIWFGRRWSFTAKNTFDGLIYAAVTAGVFGWLWPS